ncbi:MAG: bifunctional 4-hydroxy-2-oxoglutarate aldolase/2-dehydro-3-deoxy-phosphogluconate aldolase [Caulobacterales bacterium]|jgi:2-dehydro-3-deoxyphosphogluconate aldolase/(4S)-4-hydroxy-2-oxoglutarate aldolase
MTAILDLLGGTRIMPVLTISEIGFAAPLARALQRGGLRGIEVTLRTPAALAAITAMREAAPELIVGAGTIRTQADVAAAIAAGAHFLVSPGSTSNLRAAMASASVPCLPGMSTASEAMVLAEAGVASMKFFPAEQAGGMAALKSMAGPLPELRFCPTGGITVESAPTYLALPNVFCVGGSWIASDAAIQAQDWAGIEARARQAASL